MCEPITTAIALSTAISAVGSHVQGNVQKDAAKRAGGAQRTATDEAINTLDTTYNSLKGIMSRGVSQDKNLLICT